MAEERDGQERTFEATLKRREDARERGQVPRSRELSTMAILMGALIGLAACGDRCYEALRGAMARFLSVDGRMLADPAELPARFLSAVIDALLSIAPFLGLMFLIALAAPIAVGGWVWSGQALALRFERLDPIRGITRLVNAHALAELVKALVKFALILGVTVAVLWHHLPDILGLGALALEPALARAVSVSALVCTLVAATTVALAFFDVPFQFWDYARNLRMSREEVREETKQTEGRPEVRARIRSIQQERARRRMMAQVPKADVVVTNPTHYAVALRYDPATMAAPVVLAKGADLLAARIRELAREHRVTLLSAPLLARALYFSARIDQEIPAGLYRATAQVLAYVFQLRNPRAGVPPPSPPTDLPIPAEFRRER